MKERVNWGGEQKDEAPEIQLRSQVNRVLARRVRTDQTHSRGPGSKKSSCRCSCAVS